MASTEISAAGRRATSRMPSDELATGRWWLHLRTADKAGNWSAQTNLGPFPIDITAPQNPTLRSPDHTVGTPSSAPVVAVDVSGDPYLNLEREAQAMLARE